MMRSLYAGVSGLKTHQIKMDVIGNNIANVNTVAYKSSSITFSELMYQTSQNASGPNAATGRAGINPKQIGLGVKAGAISTAIEDPGASQNTGNPFDVQINGDSFFIVSDGLSNYFTRAGAFNVDVNGTLCMKTNGYTVQGWTAEADGSINKNNVGPLQIMSTKTMSSDAEATTKGYLTGIIDKNDSQLATGQVATMSIYDSKGYSYTVKFSVTETATEGQYTLKCSDILDSNTKSIFASMSAADKQTALDKLINSNAASTTVEYDTVKGGLTSVGGVTTATGFIFNATSLSGINAAFSTNIDVDLSTTKNVDNKGTSTIAGQAGTVANKAVGAGRTTGEMDSLAIQTDGKIVATYTNGVTKTLGQIAVANFANPSGLKKEGDNLYSATMNSGEFDGVGKDITQDGGGFSTGVLEMSNVDLSSEFTEMITTQRGFQANSRIITVSDTMIEELVNLKR
ncbi:MAG: flagellar hook-basal body complex protein [Lachnospiraceae bacterium]|nr:flagellar hook-basal body complex protein [Lachnospiraceae bacterium]